MHLSLKTVCIQLYYIYKTVSLYKVYIYNDSLILNLGTTAILL